MGMETGELLALGTIRLGKHTSPYEVGRRLHHLALVLGMGEVEAARTAAVVSEAVRVILRAGHQSRADVGILRRHQGSSLILRLRTPASAGEETLSLLRRVFQEVDITGEDDGQVSLTANMPLYGSTSALRDDLLAQEKILLERPSEEELLKILSDEVNFIDNALNALSDVFLVFDENGQLLRWNRRLNSICALDGQDLGRIHVRDLFEEWDASAIRDLAEYGKKAGEPAPVLKLKMKEPGGLSIPCEMTVSSLRDAEGRRVGFCGIVRDVSEHQRLEAELREALREAEEAEERAKSADRMKSAFLATMSHELRTPLNSIIGFTGILLQGLAGPLNEEQTKQLEMVRHSATHLLNLINDVLDVSKIEAGQLEIYPTVVEVREVVEAAERTVRPMAEGKGLRFTVSISPEVGTVVTDRKRLEQVLLNLLSNAVKFTETGEVSLECAYEGDRLLFCVRDTGVGIKAEDIEKLFQPFRQLDMSATRIHEGTGLGLSICKRLVEMMGGEIGVESEFGKGSAFYFYIPG